MVFNDLAVKALKTIGALGQGDAEPDPDDLETAFDAANDMLDAWAAVRIVSYHMSRNVYPVVTGKGSPSNPYTIGPGADLDQQRPVWIPQAGLILGASVPAEEMGLAILKPDEYNGFGFKTLTSNLATALYYDADYPTTGASQGYGNVFLFPVPDGQTSPLSLVIYAPVALGQFADQDTTDYLFPPGYAEAMRYQLALRLIPEFGCPPEKVSTAKALAAETYGIIKRPNVRVPKLRTDYGLGRSGAFYDWRLGRNVPIN